MRAQTGSCTACGPRSAACETAALQAVACVRHARDSQRCQHRSRALWTDHREAQQQTVPVHADALQPFLTLLQIERIDSVTQSIPVTVAGAVRRTREGHLGAELLLEGPEVVARRQRLVHVLAEDGLRHQPRLYLMVRLHADPTSALRRALAILDYYCPPRSAHYIYRS